MSDEPSRGGEAEDPRSDAPSLSEVRHALRTPLNQIIGYSQMLQEDVEDRGQSDLLPDLQKIEAASRRLVDLIDEYLSGPSRTPAPGKPVPEAMAPAAAAPAAPEAAPEAAPAPAATHLEITEPVAVHAAEETDELHVTEVADAPPDTAKLLVVDDDENNRDMLARRLERKGFQVAVAADGHEALSIVSGSKFHLVLLDVMMPGISGIEVLRELRKTYSVADLPVIMATGLDTSEDVVQALGYGANDYVTKPLDFQVVLARVETQLALKRAKDRVQQLNEELEVRNRFIQKTFGRYLSDEVVKTLLESPEGLELGGEKRRVTILMSDLRGFTSMSERLGPEVLVSILNRHLGSMADIIMSHGGTVDEFIGDAVLALFGAPVSHADDSERAVACAIAMQHDLAALNDEHRKLGLPELEMGIAINTGEVIVGNIGSSKRMKYGIVGSHVNLTARIESFTVGGQVLISEGTFREAGPDVVVQGQMAVQAKGFHEPITVYDLKGLKGKWDRMLPEPIVELREIPKGVDVQFALLEGKHIDSTVQRGRFVRLSLAGAEVSAPSHPDVLANLSFRVSGPTGDVLEGDLYAKVVDRRPAPGEAMNDGNRFAVRFTSVPPQVKAYFKELIG